MSSLDSTEDDGRIEQSLLAAEEEVNSGENVNIESVVDCLVTASTALYMMKDTEIELSHDSAHTAITNKNGQIDEEAFYRLYSNLDNILDSTEENSRED